MMTRPNHGNHRSSHSAGKDKALQLALKGALSQPDKNSSNPDSKSNRGEKSDRPALILLQQSQSQTQSVRRKRNINEDYSLFF
jgi:hypothetical protein